MRRLLSIALLTLLACLTGTAQRVMNIWSGTTVTDKVKLTAYLPEQGNGMAMVVCPGGSYHWHDIQTEGVEVARALNRHGIAALVLQYRVAGKMAFVTHWSRKHYPMMLQDVQRSLQLARDSAAVWHIDPHRVGVMGFSAGGHLALMSAALHETNSLAPLGIGTAGSLAPDFIVPVYPVVTLNGAYAHGRSRRGLLGDSQARRATMRDSLSMERHAASIACPVYLLNCVDDPIVDYHNSELMDSALTAAGVQHRYVQLPTGGHGFGVGKSDSIWLDDLLAWLRRLGMLE